MHQLLYIKTFITVSCIILTYIILTSIVTMTIHIIWNIHVFFCPFIYYAFYPELCLTMLSANKLIIHETTPNQVFMHTLQV
jgi:hypothetical protein